MREFVEAAAELRPVLERNQAAGDRDRRLTGEAMAALRDAGMFPLNVHMRDMQTALRHAMISPALNLEAFGRALLGVEPNITALI